MYFILHGCRVRFRGGWERDREPGWSRVEKVSRRKQEEESNIKD